MEFRRHATEDQHRVQLQPALASTNGIAVTGIKAWAASVNAQGGVNGHQVDLVIENDSASAGTSISEVERLINQDHVVAIGQISDVDSSWASYASQAHVSIQVLGLAFS